MVVRPSYNQKHMIEGISIVVLTTGITQVFKGLVSTRFVPLFSLSIAVILSFASLVATGGNDWIGALVTGLVAGLSSNGLYDHVTSLTK